MYIHDGDGVVNCNECLSVFHLHRLGNKSKTHILDFELYLNTKIGRVASSNLHADLDLTKLEHRPNFDLQNIIE